MEKNQFIIEGTKVYEVDVKCVNNGEDAKEKEKLKTSSDLLWGMLIDILANRTT